MDTTLQDQLEAQIKNTINAVAEYVKTDEPQNINTVMQALKEMPYDFTDPSVFETLFMYPLQELTITIAEAFHAQPSIEIQDIYKPTFVYTNYNFLAMHIENLITERMQTTVYVSDQSRTIIRMYLNYTLTGNIPETSTDPQWWQPLFGTNKEWMDFCDSVYELYYGKPKDYFECYQTLMDALIKS